MANAQKDTVYIDVDDEITSVIEKLQSSPHRIVALVLPKRAAVLQSVVNMKLLKRAGEQSKKHIVLITSESALLPLAGAVGMYVAPSLQSRPVIPPSPEGAAADEATDESDDFDPDAASDQPVGRLAGASSSAAAGAAAAKSDAFDEPETIQLDNADAEAPATGAAAGAGAAAASSAKKPRNNKLKVPNFNKFRLLLIGGAALLLLLIGGFIYANSALSKAVITLKTNSTDIDTKASLTLDPSVDQYDPAAEVLPAKIVTKQQSSNQQVGTSGQKNNGQKASGQVRMTAGPCSADVPASVPAGTGISASGQTFITQTATAFVPAVSGSKCTYSSDDDTRVIAQSPGAVYNIGPTTLTVAGRSDVTARSSEAFTGGTDNIVKTVTQSDIDSAKQRLSSQSKDNNNIKDELTNKLAGDDYTAITASLHADEPKTSASAQAGEQADTVTVTTTTTYTMYGVKEADLKSVVIGSVKQQIDESKQQIIKDGVSAAKFTVPTATSSGPLQVTMTATSLAGPDIKKDELIAQLAGKKTGQVQEIVKEIPGVSDATVDYSPFWVSKVPKKASHVHLVIEKSSGGTQSVDDE